MIATSPLTGRIFSGRINKNGNAFVGEKKDVTSEVLKAIIDKAAFHGGESGIRETSIDAVCKTIFTILPTKMPSNYCAVDLNP